MAGLPPHQAILAGFVIGLVGAAYASLQIRPTRHRADCLKQSRYHYVDRPLPRRVERPPVCGANVYMGSTAMPQVRVSTADELS